MNPDEKYMSEVKLKDNNFTFTPPSFDRSLIINDSINMGSNNFLDLSHSESDQSQLYCYYNSFDDCDAKYSKVDYKNTMPTTFDVLRGLDLDLDEVTDLERNGGITDVDKIYSEIESKNPGIHSTFLAYNIPEPISKVIVKRLIKLSLLYFNKK